MDVYFDSELVGQAIVGDELTQLLSDEQMAHVVCTRIDKVDTTFDELLERQQWVGERLDLYTFDGWLDEAARQVSTCLQRLPEIATGLAVMTSDETPIKLIDELMQKPKEILVELLDIKQHFDADLQGLLEVVQTMMVGAETVVTLAVRNQDFVCVADALRFEWLIALRSLLCFLEPGRKLEAPPSEPGPELDSAAMYASNLKALDGRFPNLISQIEAAWDQRDELRYSIDEGPSKLRSPRVNGQRMWSVVEPAQDLQSIAKQHIGDAAPEKWDSAATWGVAGNLAHTLLLDEMDLRPQIFVRPDLAAFAAELHCVDWTELVAASNIRLCTTVDEYRWTLRSCFVHQDQIRRLSSPNLLQVDPALYEALHEESGHTELTMKMEGVTGASRGRQWTFNALSNVASLLDQPDAHRLKDIRKGLPGLLVAPGPSLAKNIHLVREFAKKGVVVGVSHVLGKLQDLGVDPELTVAIEANDISSHFEGSDPTRTSLFLHESTHPNVVAQPAAQHWVVHDGEIGRRLRNDDSLRTLSMVASSCTHIAMWALNQMGCDPIVFIGLDLALEDGKQYTDGCEGSTPTQQHIETEGYNGGKVQTIAQYNVFRDQFELSISHYKFNDRRYINATEGGARIRGTDQLTLAEVVEQLAPLADKETSGAIVAPADALPVIDWAEVVRSLDDSVVDMEEAEKSAAKGLQSARAAVACFKVGDEAGLQRRGRSAARRAKKANEVLTDDHVFNGRWMAAQNARSQRFEREAQYLVDDPKALMRHNLMHYQQLLAALEEAAKGLRPLYEKAAENVREKHNV